MCTRHFASESAKHSLDMLPMMFNNKLSSGLYVPRWL